MVSSEVINILEFIKLAIKKEILTLGEVVELLKEVPNEPFLYTETSFQFLYERHKEGSISFLCINRDDRSQFMEKSTDQISLW